MKEIANKIKKSGIIENIALVIYIILVLTIATNHEYFEDETQSWLIARDLNFVEIIQQMKYEGHSFLWYYILAPFAKLGISVEIQNYISSLFAIGTVYIILKKSPFNLLTKILLTFSGGMIYFYSVLARPYCMIPFLLACIAVLYQDRKKRPYLYATCIALLANTHLIMLPTAVMLILTFWGEELILKRKQQTKEEKIKLYKSLLIAGIGVGIYLLIVCATLKHCVIVDNFNKRKNIADIHKFFNSIKYTCLGSINCLYGDGESPLYYQIIVAITMIFCIIGMKNNLKQGAIFWSQLIFTILIHSFAWFILPTRIFIVIYTLMFWAWVYKEDGQYLKKKKKNRWIEIALLVLCIISMPSAYKLGFQDIKENFSTGRIAARFIQENIPEGACFIYGEQELQQSILAYLPKDKYKLYLPHIKEFITFSTWNEEWNRQIRWSDIQEAIEFLKEDYEDLYLINGNYLSSRKKGINLELLLNTNDKLMDNFYVRKEVYNIYRIVKVEEK